MMNPPFKTQHYSEEMKQKAKDSLSQMPDNMLIALGRSIGCRQQPTTGNELVAVELQRRGLRL